MDEVWKPVPFDDRYEVSNHGRVRSWAKNGAGGRCRNRREQPRMLQPASGAKGYLFVSINGRTWFVHALVLLAFVGERPDGHVCCHGDGVRTNNSVDNLRYGTPLENESDKTRHGTRRVPEKITAEQRAELSARARGGESVRSLADAFGVSPSRVYQIANLRRWKVPSRRRTKHEQ